MTTDQHIILYNIGMKLSCNNSLDMHLCPNKKDYGYFMYWSGIFEKNDSIFGNAIGEKKVQLKRRTGEEIVSLDEDIPICTKDEAENRIAIVQQHIYVKDRCDDVIGSFGISLAQSVRNVSIEKTLVLKVNEEGWDMPMIDFIDIFDDRALLTHFRSLFKCFLEEVILGKDGTDIINRIMNLLQNWERIYNSKNGVINQVVNYIELTHRGIEDIDNASYDFGYLSDKFKNELKEKRDAKDFLSFLLHDDFDKECFQECVTVLAAFLKEYEKNSAEDLLRYLQKYENKELKIHKIRRLAKIDLSSPKAKTANAKLIERYLADKVKFSCGILFECIA